MAPLRIGTRKSPLALKQGEMVKDALGMAAEIVPMLTTGDKIQYSLAEEGGKGLFTKELEEGLLAGSLDIAVHSMKDMATELPEGLCIGAVLPREDARDAFISAEYGSLTALPQGAAFGTSSLRRAAQMLHARPDLKIVPMRGNVETRLRKIKDGMADATLLAIAGLKRLGLESKATAILSVEDCIPAVAQGIICIECREDNATMRDILSRINHPDSFLAAQAERALLRGLDGSCRTPIGGYALLKNGYLHLTALLATPDGKHCWKTTREGLPADAGKMGADAAQELLKQK